ncbi:MAG TPA: hypothetical protein VGO11_09055 [Chthoniobacteraceae bacterium]|jgi:hypothetical protein|nr:hypothetical protein [Chthoniobacteraceae bacterium]
MKSAYTFSFLLSLIGISGHADVINPLSDFKAKMDIAGSDFVYRWEVDIDGDGKKEVMLSSQLDYEQELKDGQLPGWLVYIAKSHGSGYVFAKELDEGGVIGYAIPQIDPEMLYVGMIEQIGKRGIVTMQVDHPRKAPEVAYIYAYTINGDHLKKTLLAKFEPKKGNPIYDQYLSESKRTKVKLQQVKP